MNANKIKLRTGGTPEKDYDADLAPIQLGLKQLQAYVGNNSSSELMWEIQLYEWILRQPDKKEKAKMYTNLRHSESPPVPKRDVAKKLGWEI